MYGGPWLNWVCYDFDSSTNRTEIPLEIPRRKPLQRRTNANAVQEKSAGKIIETQFFILSRMIRGKWSQTEIWGW